MILFVSCAGGASGGDSSGTARLSLAVSSGNAGTNRSASEARLSIFSNSTASFELTNDDGSYSDSASASLDQNGCGVISVKSVPVGTNITAVVTVTTPDGCIFSGSNSIFITDGDNALSITVSLDAESTFSIPSGADAEYVAKLLDKLAENGTYTLKLGTLDASVLSAIAGDGTAHNSRFFKLDFSGVQSGVIGKEFKGALNIVSVDLTGSGITGISDSAFESCTHIETVIIPKAVENVGELAFYSCTAIKTVSVAAKNIGRNSFSTIWDLESLTLGEGVEVIDSYAFYCAQNKLKQVIIPSNVKKLNEVAFRQCSKLESLKFEGKTLPKIVDDPKFSTPFEFCTKLKLLIPADSNYATAQGWSVSDVSSRVETYN